MPAGKLVNWCNTVQETLDGQKGGLFTPSKQKAFENAIINNKASNKNEDAQ